jgi:hypothetical protein
MYGFPTQTEKETINSLEMVRQFMNHGLIQSAFWHLFTLTVHSPIAKDPDKFLIEINSPMDNPFANNNLEHKDKSRTDHKKFGVGLNKALYNYMHGIGLDYDVRDWFEFPVVQSTVEPDFIEHLLIENNQEKIGERSRAVWVGKKPSLVKKENGIIEFIVRNNNVEGLWDLNIQTAERLDRCIEKTIDSLSKEPIRYSDWEESFTDATEFEKFLRSDVWHELREHFLLFV